MTARGEAVSSVQSVLLDAPDGGRRAHPLKSSTNNSLRQHMVARLWPPWSSQGRDVVRLKFKTAGGHALRMKNYPGAGTCLTRLLCPISFAGHYVGQDPAVMADSLVETRAFLSEWLAPKLSP